MFGLPANVEFIDIKVPNGTLPEISLPHVSPPHITFPSSDRVIQLGQQIMAKVIKFFKTVNWTHVGIVVVGGILLGLGMWSGVLPVLGLLGFQATGIVTSNL
jgi:hypothetical protein